MLAVGAWPQLRSLAGRSHVAPPPLSLPASREAIRLNIYSPSNVMVGWFRGLRQDCGHDRYDENVIVTVNTNDMLALHPDVS